MAQLETFHLSGYQQSADQRHGFTKNREPTRVGVIRFLKLALFFLFGIATLPVNAQHSHHEKSDTAPSSASARDSACKDTTLACARSATPAFAPDGSLWLVWSGGGGISLARSSDLGRTFEPRIELAEHGAFLDVGADARPQLVINQANQFVVAYAFFKDKQWNAQVNIIRSENGGRSFSEPRALISDAGSQRFPTLAITPEGKLFATWIDKRLVAQAKLRGEKIEGGSIATAWSSDMGKHFQSEQIVQNHSCECCRLGVGMTRQGMPILIYRAIFDGTTRDHAVQFFTNQNQISVAKRVSEDNWVTNSCPHHGPTIAVSSKGTFHTAWFTQGHNRSGSFYARSTNHGDQFSNPRRLGDNESLSGRPYLLAKGQNIWLVWKNFDGKHASVMMQQSEDDGLSWSKAKEIAQASGHTDHPLLLEHDSKVFLSWLTASDGYLLKEIGN